MCWIHPFRARKLSEDRAVELMLAQAASGKEFVMQVQRKIIDVQGTQVVLELPESFVNHRIEVIALTVDEEPVAAPAIRRPHPDLVGKGRTLGDLISPIVDQEDWAETP